MNNLCITIKGYKFVVASNTTSLPSASGTQNETLGPATAAREEDSEDAVWIIAPIDSASAQGGS